MNENPARIIFDVFHAVVLTYFLVQNGAYFITTAIAFWAVRRHTFQRKSLDLEHWLQAAGTPPVTLIAPSYNEEATCVESVRSFVSLQYPEFEILLVNDGSRDRTLATLTDAFTLVPAARFRVANLSTARVRGVYQSLQFKNLWVIDKENGGKSDALNAGLTYCRTPLFCAMDSDTVLERDALIRIARPFMEDRRTVAAGGVIRIANGCEIKSGRVKEVRLKDRFLIRVQVLEYLRAFLAARIGWDALGVNMIISGAFGIFRRSTVIEAGGFDRNTVGEDMELVVRLHRHCMEKSIPYRIVFLPDPVAWTECPESLRTLARQRDRWQRGLAECLVRHIRMLGNPRYGRIGMIAFPYFFFVDLLGPFIEVLGYLSLGLVYCLGVLSPVLVLAFFTLVFLFGLALSTAAVALEELEFRRYLRTSDFVQLFLTAFLENFGYRQLLSVLRLRGMLSYLKGVKAWGDMERKGFRLEEAKRHA